MVKKILYLETIEQVRALMEPSRMQIIREMGKGATTSKEVALAVGGSVPKIHYHLKELEKNGLIRTTGKTQKGNLVESHYEPVARSFRTRTHLEDEVRSDPATYKDLLTRVLLVASSEVEDTVVELVNAVEESDAETFAQRIRPALLEQGLNADQTSLYLTQDEYDDFLAEYRDLVKRYRKKRKGKQRKAVDVFWMSLPNIEAVQAACGDD